MGLSAAMQGQTTINTEEGRVSYVSSKNVYVQFDNTSNITVGDTLFLRKGLDLVGALVVDNKSSSSTVCSVIGQQNFKKGDVLVTQQLILPAVPKKEEEPPLLEEPFPTGETPTITTIPVDQIEELEEEILFKEKIKGRISAASYSNLSDAGNRHRMRYALAYRGYNIKNSRFSVESYVTFRHTLNDSIVLANALKVYALSVKYDIDKTANITFGRRINPRFSSVGAIDGLQGEKIFGRIRIGGIIGTRPDFRDYTFNPDLLQFGAYIGIDGSNPKSFGQTTVGFINQMNAGKTDRRFLYFQHSSTLAKNLNFFGSAEVDLYENINNEVNNQARLTNLYASLRYRIGKRFRISASYDNRRNIIYYESYRNFIDQLIEDETRQGIRLGFNHRAFKNIAWGASTNIRMQSSGKNPSRNVSAYVNISKVPFVNARLSLRANLLDTDILDSQIFGARMSKELVRGKLNMDVYYRWVDYKYQIGNRVVHQDIVGASLNWRIQKQLSLHLFYEGVFDSTNNTYHRVNLKLIKRF